MLILDLEDEEEWEIKEVKDRATIKGTTHYLVKQEGQPIEYNQQIPKDNISNT